MELVLEFRAVYLWRQCSELSDYTAQLITIWELELAFPVPLLPMKGLEVVIF